MPSPPLAASAAEVTPEWLTQALSAQGHACRITAVQAQSIGTGQVGENVRFTLAGEGDFPPSLVGKFASLDPVSRQTGAAQMTYAREVCFYQDFQRQVAIQTPRVLHVAIDPDTQDFDILMEDLAPGEQGNQLAGCSIPQAELAMREIAALHGPLWGQAIPAQEAVIRHDAPEAGETLHAVYEALAPGFLARYAGRLSERERTLVQQLAPKLRGYHPSAGGFAQVGGATLVHGDYRLDNMIFGGPYPLAVVDWQTLAVGAGPSDVAYFAGTSLAPEDRRQHEERLLRLYCDSLGRHGVQLAFEDCWQLYRRYAPGGLIMAVIAATIVGETARGNDMFMAMLKRSAQMCLDLDSLALLG